MRDFFKQTWFYLFFALAFLFLAIMVEMIFIAGTVVFLFAAWADYIPRAHTPKHKIEDPEDEMIAIYWGDYDLPFKWIVIKARNLHMFEDRVIFIMRKKD